ncbi:MAG: tripartite tricarboxylate transporter permease [Pseudomonadales bacterium]|nr:tripartite tricarboxylate transporter permease [Pseudomonadales bacterium]MCP5185487.1 tripartite tricarboxylate transporter permease [Pseudomonadales bacterium]
MFDGFLAGVDTAFTSFNMLMVITGCFAGTFIGMLPGLGPATAVALMIPMTWGLDPAAAIILMAGVYYGAVFGGSTSSILINAPGCSSTVATAFDGYPMAQRGAAGKALAVAAWSSFSGGMFGAVGLLVAAPLLAKLAMTFQSPDYALLMLLGLTAVASLSGHGQVLKGYAMALFGMMLATVGTDGITGLPRLTFGQPDLVDGLNFVLIAMATYALAEVVLGVLEDRLPGDGGATARFRDLALNRADVRAVAPVIARQSLLGFLVGVLPGAGATIASFLAYSTEKNLAGATARPPFGEGNVRGVAAPESANNAATTGAFVPLLTLGIPGSGTTAILLGAMIAHGLQPGPRLYADHPEVFWSVIVSMFVGNLMLLVINLPMIPWLAKVLRLPSHVLMPLVVVFCLLGVYLVSFNPGDVLVLVVIAAIAVFLRRLDFPMAPLLLGFILGGYLEDNLQRAFILYDGGLGFLWQRPASAVMAIATLVCLVLPLFRRSGITATD